MFHKRPGLAWILSLALAMAVLAIAGPSRGGAAGAGTRLVALLAAPASAVAGGERGASIDPNG